MRDSGAYPFWRRNLYTICLTMIVVTTGFSFVFPFIPLYLQELGIEGREEAAFWSGVLAAVSGISMAVFSPIWGVLSDRFGRKPLLLRAMFGGAVAIAIMALVTSVGQLLVLRTAQGALSGIFSPATALVAAYTPSRRLPFSIGLVQMSMSAGNAFGPVMGGLVANAAGYRTTFLVAAGLLALAGLTVVFLVRERFERPVRRVEGTSLAPRRTAWQSVVSRRMAPVFVILFVTTAAPVITFPVLPLYFASLAQGESVAAVTGLGFSLLGITAALSAAVSGKLSERVGLRTILVVSCLFGGLLYLPQALARTIPELLILMAAQGVSYGGITTAATALVGTSTQRGAHGTAFGIAGAVHGLAFSVGPLAGGLIAATLGLRAVFVFVACTYLFIGVLAAKMYKAGLGQDERSIGDEVVRE